MKSSKLHQDILEKIWRSHNWTEFANLQFPYLIYLVNLEVLQSKEKLRPEMICKKVSRDEGGELEVNLTKHFRREASSENSHLKSSLEKVLTSFRTPRSSLAVRDV